MSDEQSTEEEGKTPEVQDQTTESGDTSEVNDQQADSRPDWLPQKFETPEQLAVSYGELEKSLHTRKEEFRNQIINEMQTEAKKDTPTSPGDYEINVEVPEGMEWEVDESDPLLNWFQGKAHEYGLNQNEFDNLVNEYVAMENTKGPDWNEEAEMLGEHAEKRLERVDAWASNNFTESAYEKFANLRADAGMVQLFEEIMELNGQPKFNMTSNTEFQERLNLDEIRSMQNDPKYWKEKDPAFINKVKMAFEDYAKRKESNVN
tara:strand:+ start:2213 stop:2998 length:786 start_codon:yes stop_codon:yes gene_type:complete